MKKTRKILSTFMAMSMVASVVANFAACGGVGPGIEQIDQGRTQLYVLNFNGGFGDKWLKDIKAEFEALHANNSYENGKKGVQIILNSGKKLGNDIEQDLLEATDEIYFTEYVSPLYDYISKDYLLDITDIVTETLPGEDRSIEDKMSQTQRDFLKVDFTNSGNTKYYAIPHYSIYTGIIYDIDLFEEQGLYLLKDGGYSIPGAFFNGEYIGSGELSNGPDGQAGTYDDGMPATYDEFFALCDYMVKNKGVIPFNWFGKQGAIYHGNLVNSMHADYEGMEQMRLNFTLDGTAKNLVSVDASGNVTDLPDLEITNENGYELAAQGGYYYALKFMEQVITGEGYHNATKTGSLTYTHLQAQSDYLYSSYRQSPIAFLIEGTWWENEASDTFEAMAQFSLGKYDRRFGMLPFPKATSDKIGEKFTVYDGKTAFGFIAKNTPKEKHELAKEFLQFCYTDDKLADFSVKTNSFRDLDYTLTGEQQAQLSGFGKYLYDVKASGNLDIVYPFTTTTKFVDNSSTILGLMGYTRVDGTAVSAVKYIGKRSLLDMFNESKNYRKTIWASLN